MFFLVCFQSYCEKAANCPFPIILQAPPFPTLWNFSGEFLYLKISWVSSTLDIPVGGEGQGQSDICALWSFFWEVGTQLQGELPVKSSLFWLLSLQLQRICSIPQTPPSKSTCRDKNLALLTWIPMLMVSFVRQNKQNVKAGCLPAGITSDQWLWGGVEKWL